jgi:hypothetical protein
METLKKIFQDRSLSVETIELKRENVFQKIFSSLILADWTTFHTAKYYGADPENVPMVEEFKKLIAQ